MLRDASRHDSCAYHAGYVVECSLKAVLLHDDAWNPSTEQHDALRLRAFSKILVGKQYGHDLLALASAQIGSSGAKYWPDLPRGSPSLSAASILSWKTTSRYQGEDPNPPVAIDRAIAFMEWAELIYEGAIVEMQLDGVI